MSYQATVYQVMIASPGDVSAERGVIRETLNEWNTVNSNSHNSVLLPIGWETHSSPEMGDRPQAILNKQILKGCDLLVGVFWTRIGTSTGSYESGTVEEIEEHLKAGKPTMLYFSKTPVEMDSVDTEQYEKLKVFRESCKARGVYEVYESLSDFKDKFYRQLQLKMNNDDNFKSSSGEIQMNILDTLSPVQTLSKDAEVLLKEASLSSNGRIMKFQFIGGFGIQTNGKKFNEDNSPRERAKWDDAINELLQGGLVESRGYKGEIYEITSKGFEVADSITI
jgi:hypothetical protein